MVLRASLVLAALAAACSSHPPRTNGTGSGAAPGADAGVTAGPDASTEPVALTRDDCVELIDHVLEVGLADQRASKNPDQVPTDEQVAKVRAKLQAELMDTCLTWDSTVHACMMAAKTSDSLYACAAEPEPAAPAPEGP